MIKRLSVTILMAILAFLVLLNVSCATLKNTGSDKDEKVSKDTEIQKVLDNPVPLKPKWTKDLDYQPERIIMDENKIFVLGKEIMSEYTSGEGRSSFFDSPIRWLLNIARIFIYDTAFAKGVASKASIIEAYDRKTGKLIWRNRYPNKLSDIQYAVTVPIPGIAIVSDGLLVQQREKLTTESRAVVRFYILDPENGKMKYKAPFIYTTGDTHFLYEDSTIIFTPMKTKDFASSSESTFGDAELISRDAVIAYDLKNQRIIWEYPALAWWLIELKENQVHFVIGGSDSNPEMVSLDARDGKLLSKINLTKNNEEHHVFIENKLVFESISTLNRKGKESDKWEKSIRIRILDRATGKQLASMNFTELETENEFVYFLGMTGRKEKRLLFGSRIDDSSKIMIYDSTGKELYSYPVDKKLGFYRLAETFSGKLIAVSDEDSSIVYFDSNGYPEKALSIPRAKSRAAVRIFAIDEKTHETSMIEFVDTKSRGRLYAF